MVAYGWMRSRTQTLVQLTDELLAALDQRAASSGRSRSELIREAIQRYLGEDDADRAIVEAYRRVPQEADPWAQALARDSIAAEPW